MSDYTDDIKKRLEAATPGPWRTYDIHGGTCCEVFGPNAPMDDRLKVDGQNDANLIANAPTDIKNLLEEREVLREALKFADQVLDMEHPVVKAFNPIKLALAWEPKK